MEFLTLFISLRCTQSCAHCLYGCSPDRGEHMSWEVFAKSLSIAEENRIPTINFFGGEPLLNSQIFPMLQTVLKKDFALILATNCRPLSNKGFYSVFADITEQYKEKITIITAKDKFHLQFFDPAHVIDQLRNEGYTVAVQDYANTTVAMSEYNNRNEELRNLNTHWSCCQASWTDYLGVLPGGGWSICPPSLDTFGDIFSDSLEQITKFKHTLPFRFDQGCTECLKDFKDFREEFEAANIIQERRP